VDVHTPAHHRFRGGPADGDLPNHVDHVDDLHLDHLDHLDDDDDYDDRTVTRMRR
jgi:hypothetical protein